MGAVASSFAFLLVNAVALWVIVGLKRKSDGQRPKTEALSHPPLEPTLHTGKILELEYENIRHTASGAMQDRHTMVNYYLVLLGVVASGVLANLDKLKGGVATLLLWSVCGVGWFPFLILARLREVWQESIIALLQIREFYVRHSKDIPAEILAEAFRWRRETLPITDMPWSVFFYSASMIGLLDSIAFGAGGHLLNAAWKTVTPLTILLILMASVLFFLLHIWTYFALLKEGRRSDA